MENKNTKILIIFLVLVAIVLCMFFFVPDKPVVDPTPTRPVSTNTATLVIPTKTFTPTQVFTDTPTPTKIITPTSTKKPTSTKTPIKPTQTIVPIPTLEPLEWRCWCEKPKTVLWCTPKYWECDWK